MAFLTLLRVAARRRRRWPSPLRLASKLASLAAPPACGRGFEGGYSAAMPALANMSSPSPSPSVVAAPSSLALAFLRLSKLVHTLFQSPLVAALYYSMARVSKKFACSPPFSTRSDERLVGEECVYS